MKTKQNLGVWTKVFFISCQGSAKSDFAKREEALHIHIVGQRHENQGSNICASIHNLSVPLLCVILDFYSYFLFFGHNLKHVQLQNQRVNYDSTSVCVKLQNPKELGPIHTRDWGPSTIALRAHLLVEKLEPVLVHFTLLSRGQRSKWM